MAISPWYRLIGSMSCYGSGHCKEETVAESDESAKRGSLGQTERYNTSSR